MESKHFKSTRILYCPYLNDDGKIRSLDNMLHISLLSKMQLSERGKHLSHTLFLTHIHAHT